MLPDTEQHKVHYAIRTITNIDPISVLWVLMTILIITHRIAYNIVYLLYITH